MAQCDCPQNNEKKPMMLAEWSAWSKLPDKAIFHKLTSSQVESGKKCWKSSVHSSLKPVVFAHKDYFYKHLPHYLTHWPLLTSTFNIVTLQCICLKLRKSIIIPFKIRWGLTFKGLLKWEIPTEGACAEKLKWEKYDLLFYVSTCAAAFWISWRVFRVVRAAW